MFQKQKQQKQMLDMFSLTEALVQGVYPQKKDFGVKLCDL